MATILYRLGLLSARRPWRVITTWLLLLLAAGAGFGLFAGPVSTTLSIPGTPTGDVQERLAAEFPAAQGGSGSLVFTTTDGSPFTDEQAEEVQRFLGRLDDLPGVRGAVDGFTAQDQLRTQRQQVEDGAAQLAEARQQLGDASAPELVDQQRGIDDAAALLELSKSTRFVSADGSTAMGIISFEQATDEVPIETKAEITEAAEEARIAGVDVFVSSELAQTVPALVGLGELIGIIIAAIMLLLTLRTIRGAVIPLVSAALGIGIASLAALSFSSVVDFVSITPILAIMLGLAVGIDYSLFITNRHRTQLRSGMEVSRSIATANGTSGNAVAFAGLTVIIALLALNVSGIPFLSLMGTVGAVAVFFAILIATTFTPALLALAGRRVLTRSERASAGTSAPVPSPARPMRTGRAVVTLVTGVAVLGIVALPAAQMRLGLPAGSAEAIDSTQYKAYTTVSEKFGPGQNGPLLVIADMPVAVGDDDLVAAQVAVGQAIAEDPDVVSVLPVGVSTDRDILAFQVTPADGPDSVSTEDLVRDLRDQQIDVADGEVTLGVAGNASANIDMSEKLADALPIYLVVVIGLSLLILVLVFRSILVPLTATLGFVLSLLATFGATTAVYQLGWLGQIFGVHDPGPIVSVLPILQIGVLFGLAMDYQLFLVSGMREAHVHGAAPRAAVQQGLLAGRAVVTAAAIVMISVFSGFIFSESSTIKVIGFGFAFGVLVDAFVVRMLLIPAAMHLLGGAAWWLPRWLDRILPDVDVEGAELQRGDSRPGRGSVLSHRPAR